MVDLIYLRLIVKQKIKGRSEKEIFSNWPNTGANKNDATAGFSNISDAPVLPIPLIPNSLPVS